jgi:hypothetical protein
MKATGTSSLTKIYFSTFCLEQGEISSSCKTFILKGSAQWWVKNSENCRVLALDRGLGLFFHNLFCIEHISVSGQYSEIRRRFLEQKEKHGE